MHSTGYSVRLVMAMKLAGLLLVTGVGTWGSQFTNMGWVSVGWGHALSVEVRIIGIKLSMHNNLVNQLGQSEGG